MNAQHRKEMGSEKQTQTDTQEIKNSFENIGSRMSQCEDRISEIEDGIVVRDHEK